MSKSASVVLEMTPHHAVEQVESELGLTIRDLAQALGTDARTVERWSSGRTYPQLEARRRLAELVALYRHVRETFATPETARNWLHTPNRYLVQLTPAEVLRTGRFDRVDAALEALDSGVFL